MAASTCLLDLLRPKCPLVRILLAHLLAMKTFQRSLMTAASIAFIFFAVLVRADDKADAYNYTKEGVEAAKSKQWDKAIAAFQKAVQADPKGANNYNNLGLAYKGAGKLDESIKAYSSAIEAEPNSAANYINRGVVYSAQKKNDKAIEDFTHAIKIDSGEHSGPSLSSVCRSTGG